MHTFIASAGIFASQNVFLAYFIIYLATIFIGNISAFASFWFILQGYVGIWGVPALILTIFLANVSGDLLWYTLGRKSRDTRFGNWVRIRIPGHERAEAIALKNGHHIIFFSKFIYASSLPVIFTLGWTKVPFKKFIRSSVLSALLWLPVLLGLSYGVISGLSPLAATTAFKNFEEVFALALALFLVLNYLVARIFGILFAKKTEA